MCGVGSSPKFLSHVDKLYRKDLDGLFAASEDVRALVSHPGWGTLRRVMEAEVATIDAKLDGDRLLDSRAEYSHLHGQRGGLRAYEDAAASLIERADLRLAEQRAKHEGAAEPAPIGVMA